MDSKLFFSSGKPEITIHTISNERKTVSAWEITRVEVDAHFVVCYTQKDKVCFTYDCSPQIEKENTRRNFTTARWIARYCGLVNDGRYRYVL